MPVTPTSIMRGTATFSHSAFWSLPYVRLSSSPQNRAPPLASPPNVPYCVRRRLACGDAKHR